jgi:hypothetical protein
MIMATTHAILVQNSVQAMNIDAFNRSAIGSADIDNGNVFYLASKSTTDGEGEVWVATQPATGALKLSLSLLGTTYVSLSEGSIGTQRVTAYQFEVTDNSSNLWMAYSPEVVTVVSETGKKYKGLTNDPREFTNLSGEVFDAFKPQVGDIITITADGITGTIGTNTYAVAANGQYALAWAASAN